MLFVPDRSSVVVGCLHLADYGIVKIEIVTSNYYISYFNLKVLVSLSTNKSVNLKWFAKYLAKML